MDDRELDKDEQRAARLQEKDRQNLEVMARRRRQREEKLAEPFDRLMSRRLFMLELVIVVGFGAFDIIRMLSAPQAFSVASMLGSLLAATALVGAPVLIIYLVQYFRHRRGTEIDHLPVLRRNGLISAAILLALLLGFGLCALIGV